MRRFGNRFGPRRSFGPREMTKIKCAECGKEDEVPFKPREGSRVLCQECFRKSRGLPPRREFKEKVEEEAEEEPEEAEEAEEESEDIE